MMLARSFHSCFPLRNPVSVAVRILRCSILPKKSKKEVKKELWSKNFFDFAVKIPVFIGMIVKMMRRPCSMPKAVPVLCRYFAKQAIPDIV
jgi:hypothetical protein